MKHNVYKIIALTILFSTAIRNVSAQEPAPATNPAAVPKTTATVNGFLYATPETAEMKELREKQKALREKQAEIQREMREVSTKLSTEIRKANAERINAARESLAARTATENVWQRNKMVMVDGKLAAVNDSIFKRVARSTLNSSGVQVYTLDSYTNRAGTKLEFKGGQRSKTISKSYPLSKNDKLMINNQYGKVTVNTWSKNEVKVDIEIKAYHTSEDEAQKLLDNVTVEDSKAGNLVSFKTNITRKNSENWWVKINNGVEERRGVQVNYVVYMPSKSALDITNKFGSVELPDFEGQVNANVSFGALFKAGKLTNAMNNIKVTNGHATVTSLQSGSFTLQYGKANIELANNVNLNLDYASGSRIGKLVNGGDLNLKYSSGFKIDELDPKVKNITINSSFSPMSIKAGNTNFEFDVTVSHAGFNYTDGKVILVNKETPETPRRYSITQNYKGQYGKGSDSKVVIKSNYGSVQFL